MAPFHHPDIARLARILCALRQGQTIVLPFIPHTRGSVSEEIRLGRYRPDSDDEEILYHAIHRTKRGSEHAGRFEPVSWSIDDLMVLSADWPSEVLDALPSVESIVEEPCYTILHRLDAGEAVIFSGTRLVAEAREPDDDNPCRVAITSSSPINAEYTASELASYKPR